MKQPSYGIIIDLKVQQDGKISYHSLDAIISSIITIKRLSSRPKFLQKHQMPIKKNQSLETL